MSLSYIESEKIINAVKEDLGDINEESEYIYDTILLAVDEYLQIYAISVDDFIHSFSLERWSQWAYKYDMPLVTDLLTLLQATHFLEECKTIESYIPINYLDFLGGSCEADDFFFYVLYNG